VRIDFSPGKRGESLCVGAAELRCGKRWWRLNFVKECGNPRGAGITSGQKRTCPQKGENTPVYSILENTRKSFVHKFPDFPHFEDDRKEKKNFAYRREGKML